MSRSREFRVGDKVYHIKEKLVGTIISIKRCDITYPIRVEFDIIDRMITFRLNGFEYGNDSEKDRIILTHD